MSTPVPPAGPSRATRVAAVLAAFATIAGLLTLVGWAFEIHRLADWDLDGVAQMPNNAIALAAAGTGLLFSLSGKRALARAFAAVATLIALATLFEWATNIDLGIDTLILHRSWGQRGTVAPGRMGFPGAMALAIIGCSIILGTFRRTRVLATIGGLTTIAISALSLIGYLFRADPLYTIPRFTAVAMQTSMMLFLIGAALVASVPERAPTRLLIGDSAAALLLRRAAPGLVLLPLLIGWLGVRGQEARLFDTAFGAALLVVALITVLVALLWWSAAAIAMHERAMRQSRDRLADILGSITDAFLTCDANWRLGFVNADAAAMLQRAPGELVTVPRSCRRRRSSMRSRNCPASRRTWS